MKQPSETNGPDEETTGSGEPAPVYVPESEVPTVTVPLPDKDDPAVAQLPTSDPDAPASETVPDVPAPDPEPTVEPIPETQPEPVAVADSEVEAEAKPVSATQPDPASAAQAEYEPETRLAPEALPEPETTAWADSQAEVGAAPASATQPEPAPQTELEAAPEPVPETHPEPVPEPTAWADPEAEPVAEAQAEPEPVAQSDFEAEPEPAAVVEPEDGFDPRAGFSTIPLQDEATVTPPLGEHVVQDGWGGRELVEDVYRPLAELYEHLDARLKEVPEDVPPAGWAPHVAALQALRSGQVAGDWETLARFLVAPGTLDAEPDGLRLVRAERPDEVVREIVKELAAADERALLIAPTPERAAELLLSLEDDPEVFSLKIETHPAAAESPSVATQALPPLEDEPGEPNEPPVQPQPPRRPGSSETVEFAPLPATPEPQPEPEPQPAESESASAVTRVEPLPALPATEPAVPEEGPSAPETRIRTAALRPVGQAWRQSWDTETRLLRRGLMWLEQWPRDAAALQAVQDENLRRAEALEAERAALTGAIEESRNAATAAGRTAEEAEAEAERLVAVQEEAEAELAGPRAEAERLQAIADESAAGANALTRTADASYTRCVQLDERAKTAQAELQAARQAEASLTDELARAREALPGAAEEAHRLTAADADAAAEGHAAYYRLVSAESALSGVRRKMTLGQRLHVSSPPEQLSGLRAEVKARTRDADEAAKRAREAKDAAEHAERVRRGLASFVSEGGAKLRAAQEAQERLGTELTWLATERETATAEHREHARAASEAVEKATEDGLRARAAQQAAHAVQERVNAARTARNEALATSRQARADAEVAARRAAEKVAELERRTAEAAEETSAREADLETAARTEARSRENVVATCGADPADDPAAVPGHQRRAMARIEQLTGYLDGELTAEGDVLLRTADLVAGTPVGVGLAVGDEPFDALIVADAGAVTDAEFLIGAVRARRWVLVSAPGLSPAEYREYADAPSGRQATSPFGRAEAAAPGLVEEG
ncbi:hypothetical protein ACFOY4_34525 [Actinomadura syzygii]|uniref:Uncharacterized protein n=1 Tax=Actinomadura syzygii TaxID=1427538 RepID=A0A5D0ULP0_9ACTN|nr:hypothetical protein [Actinomadura syzygii]TYC18827.1 hypothetical protein FXF65_03570 [Actinomadura syzygii]